MHDLYKVPWDCDAEHPDLEQPVREIIAATREQEEGKRFFKLAQRFVPLSGSPKSASLPRVLLFLVVPPSGMPAACGQRGCY